MWRWSSAPSSSPPWRSVRNTAVQGRSVAGLLVSDWLRKWQELRLVYKIITVGLVITGGWGASTSVEVWSPDTGLLCHGPNLPDRRYLHSAGETVLYSAVTQSPPCSPHTRRPRSLWRGIHKDFLHHPGGRHPHLDQPGGYTGQEGTCQLGEQDRPALHHRGVVRHQHFIHYGDCRHGEARLLSPTSNIVRSVQ